MDILDYSWARPAPAAIKAAGYGGVIRYISYEPSKNLSRAERDALWAQGLSIGLVWETTAQAPLQGRAKGVEHAREANAQAQAHGWPSGKALIYAVDFDPTPSQYPAVADYFRGALSVGGRPVGVYGPDQVLDYLAEHVGLACYWQCAAWSGWGTGSGGSIFVPAYGRPVQLSRHACLFQFYGSERLPTTDHNESTPHAGGQLVDLMYHPDGHEPPTESPEEIDMTKAVFLPEHTGGVGWLPMLVNGRRVREGYRSAEDLAADGGLVDGSIELRGAAAERFLARYEEGPIGPRLFIADGSTRWGREVAGLGPEESGRFFLVPNAYVVRIRHDDQWAADRWVGVPDVGTVAEPLLWNQPLLPWAVGPVDAAAVTAAVERALAEVEIDAEVSAATVEHIARRVVEAQGAALSNG